MTKRAEREVKRMPDKIEYNGIEYDWNELYAKMDENLIKRITNQYSGKISRSKLLEEYVVLEGWFHILRTSRKYEVKESDVTR